MTRNIRIFLVTEAILAACGGFILPIYVLYFRYFSITLFEVALLAAVFETSVLIFEIPTGLLADRFGRKQSVAIGFTLFAVSGLVFILFRNLTGFIFGEIIFGLAEAFISGAGEALAVDSIEENDKDRLMNRVFILRSRIRIVATTVFMLGAGFLFIANVSITFYPILLGGLAGLGASMFFVVNEKGDTDGQRLGFFAPIGNMLRQIKISPLLKIIFILSVAANFSFEGADQYWQILSSEIYDIDIRYFGLLTAAGAVIAFFLVGPVTRRAAGGISLPLMILILAGVVISSLPNIPAMLLPLLLILYFICKEMITPTFSIMINRAIKAEGRATFLSGYNLACSVGEVGSGLIVGIIASRLGLPVVFVLCGGFLVLATVTIMFKSALVSGK
ncbi:MAG: MFS transporter [FCB group bacterium]|nr:MFS transporter [FCB group bacterium]